MSRNLAKFRFGSTVCAPPTNPISTFKYGDLFPLPNTNSLRELSRNLIIVMTTKATEKVSNSRIQTTIENGRKSFSKDASLEQS